MPPQVDPAGDANQTMSELDAAANFPVLMRATDGKAGHERHEKVKIRTVVQPNDLDQFFARYAEVCRANMVGLKKRDKGKKKRAKRKKRPVGEINKQTQ